MKYFFTQLNLFYMGIAFSMLVHVNVIHAANSMSCNWQLIASRANTDSPLLQSESSTVSALSALETEAISGYLPRLDLVGVKGDSNTSILNSNSKKRLEEYGFEAGISLFEGFATQATLRKRRVEKEAAIKERDLRSIDLRYELRRAFFRKIVLQERTRFADDLVKRQEETLRLLTLKYKSGREPKWSVDKAKSDLAEARLKLTELSTLQDLSIQEISTLVGAKLDCSMDSLELDTPLMRQVLKKESLQDHSLNVKRRLQIEAAAQEVRVAESDFYPKLELGYAFKKQANENVPDPVSVSSWALNVKFNIFDGLGKNKRVEAARAKLLSYELLEKAKELELDFAQEKAFQLFQIRRNVLPVKEESYRAAQNRVETVSKQYSLGLKTFIDWEQAQAKLIEAELGLVDARAEALQALADLEKAQGIGLGNL